MFNGVVMYKVWRSTPPVEYRTSVCVLKDYRITGWRAMRVKGVTWDGRLVVETNYFLWKPIVNENELEGGLIVIVKERGKDKGCLELVKRRDVGNFKREHVQLAMYESKLLCWKKLTCIFTLR